MAKITTEKELMDRVVKMLPKGIPAEAIEEVEIENWNMSGRYWVYLNDGWMFERCHIIHENSLDEIRKCLKMVEPYEADPIDDEIDFEMRLEAFCAGFGL